MAEHNSNSGPVEIGAAMDYSEHEKTYSSFLKLAKYGSLVCIAIMIAMAFGFFVGGFVSGVLAFFAVCIAGYFLL